MKLLFEDRIPYAIVGTGLLDGPCRILDLHDPKPCIIQTLFKKSAHRGRIFRRMVQEAHPYINSPMKFLNYRAPLKTPLLVFERIF